MITSLSYTEKNSMWNVSGGRNRTVVSVRQAVIAVTDNTSCVRTVSRQYQQIFNNTSNHTDKLVSPVSPLDNTFALPAEVFSSCLAIVSAVMVGGLFLWPALRYGTGYHTVWEIRLSAETPSSIHWRRFYFQLTRVYSALELSGRCALQIYLLTYLLIVSITSQRQL